MGITPSTRTKTRKSRRSSEGFGFYEFFAGGGMARAGLGEGWNCLFANDFDPKKAAAYCANWGDDHLHVGDVAKVKSDQLPGVPDMVWGSFPCQDLSLAGAGAGLSGNRSGTFWPFWRLVKKLAAEGRAPQTIVLENVYGALTSHDGKDFAAIGDALSEAGYNFGAAVIDAALFLPQSRPRLFIVAVHSSIPIDDALLIEAPSSQWHPQALLKAQMKLSKKAKLNWVWWNLPAPALRNSALSDLIEENPKSVKWHTQAETNRLIGMMSKVNREKLDAAKKSKTRQVGSIYKRTRVEDGVKVQRAEVRFDETAGCLRTPGGGSSRQTIIIVERGKVRSRLLSTREAARLMGLDDSYILPDRYNDAYHLAGDGVAVPVVRFLATHLIEPLISRERALAKVA